MDKAERHRRHRRIHLCLTLFWMVAFVPTLVWWKESILWLGLMSCWANFAGHWAAYEASDT